MRKLFSYLLLLLVAGGVAYGQQAVINCAPNQPCTVTGPYGTHTGDAPYLAFGKTNGNFTQLFNMFGPVGLLRGNGPVPNPITAATSSDVVALFSNCSAAAPLLGYQGACLAGGGMVYPAAGLAVSTGSAWGTSITLGSGMSTFLGYAWPTPVSGDVLGWDGSALTWVTNGTGGTVTLPTSAAVGDIWYGSASDTMSALSGNTSTTPTVLEQTGTGSASAAPTWTTTSTLSGLTADTSPAADDLFLIHSIAASADESITISELLSGMLIPTASSTTTTAGDCFLSTTTAGVYAPGACPSGGGVTVESGGTSLGTATTINFTSPLSATLTSGVATVTSSGGSASATPIIMSCSGLAQASTFYLGPGNCTDQTVASPNTIPLSGTFQNLYVQVANTPASGQSYTFLVTVVGTTNTITCTISNPNTSCSDTTDTTAISAGGSWGIEVTTSSTSGGTGNMSATVGFTP